MNIKRLDELCELQRKTKQGEHVALENVYITNSIHLNFDKFIVGITGTFETVHELHDGIEPRYITISHVFEYHGSEWHRAKGILESYPSVDLEGRIELQEWDKGEEKVLLPVLIVKKIKGRGIKLISILRNMERHQLAPWDSIQKLKDKFKDQYPEEDISDYDFKESTKSYVYSLEKEMQS